MLIGVCVLQASRIDFFPAMPDNIINVSFSAQIQVIELHNKLYHNLQMKRL